MTFQDNLGKPVPERQTILDFTGPRDDVAVASAGPYANHLHLTPDTTMPVPHHSDFFTGWVPFLPPNQQTASKH